MAGRNVTARFSVEADVAQAKRDLEGITQQVDQLGKTKVDNVRQELEQLTASTGKLAGGYTALTQEQRQAYQQREQDAQSVERLRRSYKTLEGALEAVDVQVQHGHRSAEDAVRIQGLLAQAYGRTNAVIGQSGQAFQGGVNATRAAIVAQESAAASTKRLNGVMQQAGWQVSDFANQMANGGNVATAAGMQLGQLLGSLGPMGAAIGAVVNVGGVLAGVLTKTGDEAELTSTSFTSYTKALEFAKRASEEMKGASEGVRAALEAEGRAAVDAAQKRLTKAESELKALEAGIMSTPDAASAAGAALKYLWDAGKVKELRQEIEVLRGTLGQYNDGAREVRVSTEQGSGALKNARNAIEEYRESLRQQIDQTKLLADNEDLSNAGKLRARLETEALARAQAAGQTEIDAGTKALIKDLVAQQERIDTLEEEEKASKKATTAAETLEKARKKVVDDLDRDIAAQKRLAEAAGMSAAQQAEANVQTRIAAELAKAHTTASTEEGKAIAAKVKEAERWKRVAADEKLLKSAEDQLAYARQELALMGQSANVRDRALKSIQIQRDAVKEWGDTTSDAARKWIALQEQIADTQAIKTYQEEVQSAAKDIARDWSETLYDAMILQDKQTSIIDAIKALGKRIAVALLETNIVLPITTSIVGSAPSLFGIQSPVTGAANQNGGMGGTLSNASTLISAGRSGLSLLNGGAGLAATQYAGSFATSSVGQALGLSQSAAGIIPEAAASDMMLTSSGNALVSGAGTIGAAMPYGVIGGIGGSLIGTAANSKAVGALSGAALGAGSAGLGASIWGMSAVGGPWGIAAAAVISAVMAMIGTQKATVGPTASADITINAGGKSASAGNFLVDNDGKIEDAQNLGAAFSTIFSAAASGGGTLTKDFGIGRTAAKGLYVAGSVPYQEFGTGEDALGNLLRYTLLDQGGLQGGGANVTKAIQRTKATTYEDAAKDIALGASIDAGVTALAELDRSLNSVTKSAREATAESLKPMLDELARARSLDLGAEYVNLATGQITAYLDALKNPVEWTQAEQDMASLTGRFDAIREALQQLNPELVTYVNQIEEETRARIKADAQASYLQQLNEAQDRGYINQINELIKDRDVNQRSWAAVGLDPANATTLFNTQLTKLLKTLEASQLADVATSFGGSIADLAATIQQAATTTTTATEDLAATARSSWASVVSSSLSAAQSVVSQWSGAADKIKSARLSLALGEYSALNPGQQLAVAQKQWADTLAKAQAGDVAAVEALQTAGDAFLKADRLVNATANPDAYYAVQAGLSSVETVAQRQLSAAQQQVTYLSSIDSSLKSLDATTAEQAKMAEILSNSSRNWGASESVGSNLQLALKTGYTGDFGGGGFQSWIVNQSDSTKAIARQVLTSMGQSWRINGFATGTPGAPPGWAWVGEQGPELMRFGGGEAVIPNAAAVDMAKSWASSWTAANDRWSGNVVPLRAPQSGGGSDGAAAFNRLAAKFDRLIAAVERADANAGGQRGAIAADLIAAVREVRDETSDVARKTANALGR